MSENVIYLIKESNKIYHYNDPTKYLDYTLMLWKTEKVYKHNHNCKGFPT